MEGKIKAVEFGGVLYNPEELTLGPATNSPEFKGRQTKPAEGLLTLDEERVLRWKWAKLNPDTRPSWRDYWLKAQQVLTRQDIADSLPDDRLQEVIDLLLEYRSRVIQNTTYNTEEYAKQLLAKTASILQAEGASIPAGPEQLKAERLDRPELRRKLKDILEYETSLCLNPTEVGKDDCGVESGSADCSECQLDQIMLRIYNWGLEDCPHKRLGWHTPRWSSECQKCWQSLKGEDRGNVATPKEE